MAKIKLTARPARYYTLAGNEYVEVAFSRTNIKESTIEASRLVQVQAALETFKVGLEGVNCVVTLRVMEGRTPQGVAKWETQNKHLFHLKAPA